MAGSAGGRKRPLGRVLLGGAQPAVEVVAPNSEVTGAILQNGERRACAERGVIMCIIGDLLSCMDAKSDDSAPEIPASSEFADSVIDGRVAFVAAADEGDCRTGPPARMRRPPRVA